MRLLEFDLKKILFFLILCLKFELFAMAKCPNLMIPKDHSIDLSIQRNFSEYAVTWTIQGAFVVDKELDKTFEAAKKIERLEHVIPLINIFNLSEDRTQLQSGIQLLPGLKFQQTFKIEALNEIQKFNVQFIEGSFTGLIGQVCFSELTKKQTKVILSSAGSLANDPVPFFITNSMLERLSKSVLRRWRNDIESQN